MQESQFTAFLVLLEPLTTTVLEHMRGLPVMQWHGRLDVLIGWTRLTLLRAFTAF